MKPRTECQLIAPRVLVRCDQCKRAQPNRRSVSDVVRVGFNHVACGCIFCGHLIGTYA